MLIVAATLAIAIGIVHSYLGERFILMRLFRQPLPKLFGSDHFTKQTLRFAWHVTTVAWVGFAFLLIALNRGELSASYALNVIGATFAITGTIALFASRGKHLSWIVFGAIAAICFVGAA